MKKKILFLFMLLIMVIPNVKALGSNNTELDPTSWIGSKEGEGHIKNIKDKVSLTLNKDGTYSVNAPKLKEGFRYVYGVYNKEDLLGDIPDFADYNYDIAEILTFNEIYSSKTEVDKKAMTDEDYSFSTFGPGVGDREIPENNRISFEENEYVYIAIIEDKDYNDLVIVHDSLNGDFGLVSETGVAYGVAAFKIDYGMIYETGKINAPDMTIYNNGKVKLPTMDVKGYKLIGWYSDENFENELGKPGDIIEIQTSLLKNSKAYGKFEVVEEIPDSPKVDDEDDKELDGPIENPSTYDNYLNYIVLSIVSLFGFISVLGYKKFN